MKKRLSVLVVFCLLFTLCLSLASCSHECEWDEGAVTAAATQEAPGVKTFTCKTCGETRTEEVLFTGLTEAEWNAAFADAVFLNFAYSEVATTSGNGFSIDTVLEYNLPRIQPGRVCRCSDSRMRVMLPTGRAQMNCATNLSHL